MCTKILLSGTSGAISIEQLEDDIEVLHINHVLGKASISLYGGHVLQWCLEGHQEVLWLSDDAEFKQGKAIRGGIPLCWPWFGPNIDAAGNNGGNHGFARNNNWRLANYQLSEDSVTIELVLSGQAKHVMWPEKFELKQVLQFGKSFNQTLLMTNLSSKSVKYSCALHSYFLVSHPNNSQVAGLNDKNFYDKHQQLTQQSDHLDNCVGPIDRIYYINAKQELIDSGWRRKIEVNSTCQEWVLWNPGEKIAKGMSDVHSNGENEFVCLEAANTHWQDIPAGGVVEVAQQIHVAKY